MKYVLNIWNEKKEFLLRNFGNYVSWIKFKEQIIVYLVNDEDYFFYISFPFCESLCNFCNIPVFVRKKEYIDKYIDFIFSDINFFLDKLNKDNISFYLGGGTWNIYNSIFLKNFLSFLSLLGLKDNFIEIDLVPWNIDNSFVRLLNDYSFRWKLNIGLQSLENTVLENINRKRQVNLDINELFDNLLQINNIIELHFDFILGLPGENYEKFLLLLLKFIKFLDNRKLLDKVSISINKLDLINNHFHQEILKEWFLSNKKRINYCLDIADSILSNYGIVRDNSKYWYFVEQGKVIGIGLNADGILKKDNKSLLYRNVSLFKSKYIII